MKTVTQTDHQSIETLDYFFSLVDSEKIFKSEDETFFRDIREKVWSALCRLLIWQRPFLETLRGLHWPYDALKRRVSFFEEQTQNGNTPFIRKQARLFLLLLPFPGQWRRLLEFPQNRIKDLEIDSFFKKEQRKIKEKFDQKKQTVFKLNHFCQILKKPRLPDEKGVLRIFSLPYLFTDIDFLKDLNRRYVLFVEPPMGVVFRHTWWRSFCALDDPSLFGIGGDEDSIFLQNQPGIITTDLAHGDFLDERIPVTIGAEKRFDIVFNATFDDMPRKRHDLMLSLLQHPLLMNTTALFLGRGKEKNIALFKKRIHRLNLEKRVTVRANLPREDIPRQLAKCKVGVSLSLYENACRSIYEFFRSDLPCVISSSMAGINPKIINRRTGVAVSDQKLPEAIAGVLCNRRRYTPRKWFLDRSGSFHSTRKLNNRLKRLFQKLGYAWNEDIVPLLSSGPTRYADFADAAYFRPESKALSESFMKRAELPVSLSID